MNLYVGTHIHHIEDVSAEKSDELVAKIMAHATRDRYFTTVEWENVGDLVIWDNTAVVSPFLPIHNLFSSCVRRQLDGGQQC